MNFFGTALSNWLRVVAAALLIAFGLGAAAKAATVTGRIGHNLSGGPFQPGFVEWQEFGSGQIGGGLQLCYQSCADHRFDFTETGMNAYFYGWSRDAPFNGFVFEFGNLVAELTGVTLGAHATSLSQANISHTADAFAIDLNGWVWGPAEFSFEFTAPAQVPLPPTLLLLATALLVAGSLQLEARSRRCRQAAHRQT